MLDIGASSDKEVRELGIQIGDTIVPNTELTQLSEYRYSAKAWDNRYGCVIVEILELLCDVDVDIYVGANVQEEVGLRGAKPAAELIQPDVALVVDCSPANDIKGVNQLSGELGGGTLIRIKDGTMILQPEFRDYLIKLAEDNHIKYQYYISQAVQMVEKYTKLILVFQLQ